MGAIEILPSLKAPEPFDEVRFLRFLETRPEDERWQLIDGEPFCMMNPATGRHQRIATNLERCLAEALRQHKPELDAIRELGLMVEGHPTFRPIADVAVVPFDLGPESFFSEFYLAAEVLSPSNTFEHISRKREHYSQGSHCLHVLILHQDEVCVEIWSRSNEWRGRVFRSAEDAIELPEFGFSCRIGELYRGTAVT